MTYGKYTYGSPNILWKTPESELIIGNFCSIAQNVTVYLGGNHRHDFVTTYPFGLIHENIFNFIGKHPMTKKEDVIIGNDVWIAENVIIMSGVTIGDGAVIANNSHVVKDVEPYSIVGGNPAKFIKYRFSKEQIENLLKIKWWYWNDDKINKFKSLFTNIDEFIKTALEMDKIERSMVKTSVFLLSNSALLLNTINHYKTNLPLCEIIIYDKSLENSAEAKNMGCRVVTCQNEDETDIKNNCWKCSTGWIIMTDELLCITEDELYEEAKHGTTILNIKGTESICFLRDALKEVNYENGNCYPVGNIKYSEKQYECEKMV